MSDLPFISMTGGLVDDVELRFTPSGKAVASFRLASKKRIRDSAGQWVDGDPIYLSVTVWEGLAEHCAETLIRRGQRVSVQGRLEQQWWDAKDGSRQSKFVIIADTVAVDLQFSNYEEKRIERTDGGTTGAADPWASTPPQTDEPPF